MDVIAAAIDNLRCSDDVDGFDAMADVAKTVTTPSQDLLVASCVKVGEAFAEFELCPADVDVAVGGLFALHLGR